MSLFKINTAFYYDSYDYFDSLISIFMDADNRICYNNDMWTELLIDTILNLTFLRKNTYVEFFHCEHDKHLKLKFVFHSWTLMLRSQPKEERKRQDRKEVHAMLNQYARPQLTFPRAVDECIGLTYCANFFPVLSFSRFLRMWTHH
jgi:hypothetical protein